MLGTSSNEGSPFDQVGITSEVASIIREFTQPFSEEEEPYSGQQANLGFVRCFYKIYFHPHLNYWYQMQILFETNF